MAETQGIRGNSMCKGTRCEEHGCVERMGDSLAYGVGRKMAGDEK